MAEVHVLDHPLIQHKLAVLRSKDTPVKEFRELVGEIAGLMCYEATRKLPLKEVEVETPVAVAKCRKLSGKKLAIVPVLRAGLGMVDQMVALIPSAKIGHIGLYRDPETHKPVEYYCKLPEDIANRQVFVVDPMLATGGSAVAAIDFLKEHGCKNIIMMNRLHKIVQWILAMSKGRLSQKEPHSLPLRDFIISFLKGVRAVASQ